MNRITLFVLLVVFSVNAFAMNAKDACDGLKPVVQQIQSQVPLDVDYMTTLTGVQVLYLSDICYLNYNYVIKSEALIKDMVAGNGLTPEENLAFLKTPDGVATMQSTFDGLAKNSANANFSELKSIKGMNITYSYSFDDISIQSIKAVVLNN